MTVNRDFDMRGLCRSSRLSGLQSIGDMNAYHDWEAVFSGVDVVIHLVALVHKPGLNDAELYLHNNFSLVETVARSASDAGVKRFVFLSSIKVNGEDTIGNSLFNENDAHNPSDAYGLSKSKAEQFLLDFARQSSLEVVIIRPPLVYGPGVKANFKSLWQLASLPIPLPFASIENKRDMISVYNLCDFILKCVDAPQAKNQVFLVSDQRAYSLAELITSMRQAQGKPARLFNMPESVLRLIMKCLGKADMADKLFSNLQLDSTLAKNLLGWTPPYTLEQTLAKMATDTKGDQ